MLIARRHEIRRCVCLLGDAVPFGVPGRGVRARRSLVIVNLVLVRSGRAAAQLLTGWVSREGIVLCPGRVQMRVLCAE
jgi:hypothetical protein